MIIMKKTTTLIAVIMGLALWAGAQESIVQNEAENDKPNELTASVEVTAASSYVWRGQVLNDRAVIQPSIQIEKSGKYGMFALGAWNNLDCTDRVMDKKGLFSETDLSLTYSLPFEQISVSFGILEYLYPNTDYNSTRELFTSFEIPDISLGIPGFALDPVFQAYRDVQEATGTYLMLGIAPNYSISDMLTVTIFYSMGYADKDYNDFYFGTQNSLWNDGNLGLTLDITPIDVITLTLGVQYTWLWSSAIKDAAETIYFNDGNQLTYSLNAAYTF